jgi:hypothetical protein
LYMTWASSSWITYVIKLEFHHFVSWSMSSATFAFSATVHLGDWT